MRNTSSELYRNVGLLKSVLAELHRYSENIDRPGNKEFFEVARQAAADVLLNIGLMIRELDAADLASE